MDYNSNKSKGYIPIASGANMTGYYMGGSSNLMDMMQTGGQATKGGALLAQARQRQSDQRSLERAQRAEAERQKKGGLFGTVAGLGGGLLGAALAPLTGGASLALGAGLGTAAGTFLGESLGAGKSKKVDRSGTVYGQEQFRDVEQASRDYTKGKLERALASGGKAALSAYASPGGGIYGKVSRDVDSYGLLGKGRGFLTKTFTSPSLPVAPNVERITDLSSIAGELVDPSASAKIFDPSSIFPESTYNPMASVSGPLLASGSFLGGMQDGGLVEYQYGGGVGNIQSILNEAGMTTTPEQLALFEQFDDTALNQLAKGLQDNLLSGTQQAAQQQAGAGFAGSGAVQQAQAQQRERAMEDLTSAQEQAARDFESQTLGQAAQMIQEGAEFGGVREEPQFEQAPTEEAGWSPPQNPQQGATYAFNNQNWIWDGSNWVIGEQFTYDMDSYYDDLYG